MLSINRVFNGWDGSHRVTATFSHGRSSDTTAKTRGKRVAAFNSLLSRAERGYVLRHLSQYKFLFLSPEMLTNPSLLEQLKKQDIALYVVDEAHCVSQWGVDFRPEYQQLGKIREHLGNPVTLALTATATDLVAKDIRQVLFDRQPKEVRQSVNRQNISLFVRKTQQKEQELEQFMESAHGAAIIYCATKKKSNVCIIYSGSAFQLDIITVALTQLKEDSFSNSL